MSTVQTLKIIPPETFYPRSVAISLFGFNSRSSASSIFLVHTSASPRSLPHIPSCSNTAIASALARHISLSLRPFPIATHRSEPSSSMTASFSSSAPSVGKVGGNVFKNIKILLNFRFLWFFDSGIWYDEISKVILTGNNMKRRRI